MQRVRKIRPYELSFCRFQGLRFRERKRATVDKLIPKHKVYY